MSMEYCTYLTTYKGTKMPMFYIGRSNVKNVQNGYHGSVSSKLYKQIWLEELEQIRTFSKPKYLQFTLLKKKRQNKKNTFIKSTKYIRIRYT